MSWRTKILGWTALSLLGACAGPSSVRQPNSAPVEATAGALTPAQSPEELAKERSLYGYAHQFDAYLRRELESPEEEDLVAGCQSNESANPFCYAVNHHKEFLKKAKAEKAAKRRANHHRRSGSARAHFNRQNKVLNWADLRKASIPGLVRGFSRLKLAQLHALQRSAFAETECPNNAAIATAVALEDSLPDGTSPEVLGRLFEKGGMCLEGNPADKEQVLTRAGLFYFAMGDYSSAATVLAASSQISEAFAARALYWLYRSRSELGDQARAQAAMEELQARYPFSFHTLVALTAAHQDPGQILLRSSPHEARRSRIVQTINPLIEEVELLYKFHFSDSATKVLDWAVLESHGVEPEVLIYIAELKKEGGDYQSKISILSDVLYANPSLISRETMELYFPKVYFPIFEKQSSRIDPYLLLAIARRESAFDPRAVSPARARGLLQVMPATGRMLSPGRRKPNLFDPEINVDIGARYVLELLNKTEGQIHLALAAYNAGLGRLNTWTSRYPAGDSILFIDLIPFRETREYVASILRNYYWYRRIHQGDDQITPQRLLELANSREHG